MVSLNKWTLLGWTRPLGDPPSAWEEMQPSTHCPGEQRPTMLSLDIFLSSGLGEDGLECPAAYHPSPLASHKAAQPLRA